ncbi:hypothetical protein PAHAL_7G064400 [Panicum hallii]|uniref:No apical meristem-associated C-terminal domain-containing protein n=1 Tax=Panicum hallii TaxID=206008 RepID=A0A2T8IB83_9POAL|nr:hypothetical protein PAHAL_7G064400 [Panicum hallii]
MHNRVVPPIGLDGRMPQDLLSSEEVAICNLSSGSYFTDLLVNDVEESQDLPPPSQTTNGHAPAAAKGSQGRSKNFRDEEDILLVSAWLNVGMDAIQGIDQPLGIYWRRIHEYFNANKTFESDCTQDSLMNRWSIIQHAVNLFCGCLPRIETRNHSGWSVENIIFFMYAHLLRLHFHVHISVLNLKITNACALLKAEDNKQKKFAYMHCWKILKDKPKWLERCKQIGTARTASSKKQKIVANPSPSSAPANATTDTNPSEGGSGRPKGKKKKKQKLWQRSTIEALDYLMSKMKESDVEKDLKKQERCNKAFAL